MNDTAVQALKTKQDIDRLSINTISMLAVDAVQKAKSGHPGLPMGAAAMAYVLWTRHLRHHPANPKWFDRDRFVLSAGHGSMLLYALLHLTGYDLPLDEIKKFRQWQSIAPGHPESGITPGVEVTTGPLGQGFGNGIGMAIAEQFLAERFNSDSINITDHYTYAIVSDGDLQEGVTAEAASYAGTQRLGKLIYLYDDNGISIEGDTDTTFCENVAARFEAYGWHVIDAVDGHDVEAIDAAIVAAKAQTDKPSLLICHTTIGFGSPNKAGTGGAHGAPLGEDEVLATKKNIGWPTDSAFLIPDEVLQHFRQALEKGQQHEAAWNKRLAAYADANPEKTTEFKRMIEGVLPDGWDSDLPAFSANDKPLATRAASGKVLNSIFKNLPDLLGGSADLAPSNNSWLNEAGKFGWDKGGHNMQFGIREHAMGSMALGIAHHGGAIPYTATFLVFADYMRPPMRLAALAEQRVIFIFTHDSIGVGEDGPTHQPIEQLASLRAIPNLWVFRPADATETVQAWRQAISRHDGPAVLVFSRQNLPVMNTEQTTGAAQGGYVLHEPEKPAVANLIATGSEVSLAISAAERLRAESIHVRVVSMPCCELFDMQSEEYRASVLPAGLPKLVIEAGCSMGWHKYTGQGDAMITIDRFGASAPGGVLMEKFGFNVDNVIAKIKQIKA